MAEIAAAAVLIDVVALVKSAASETMARVRASRGLGALAGFSVVKTAPTRFLLFLSFVACTHKWLNAAEVSVPSSIVSCTRRQMHVNDPANRGGYRLVRARRVEPVCLILTRINQYGRWRKPVVALQHRGV